MPGPGLLALLYVPFAQSSYKEESIPLTVWNPHCPRGQSSLSLSPSSRFHTVDNCFLFLFLATLNTALLEPSTTQFQRAVAMGYVHSTRRQNQSSLYTSAFLWELKEPGAPWKETGVQQRLDACAGASLNLLTAAKNILCVGLVSSGKSPENESREVANPGWALSSTVTACGHPVLGTWTV